MVSDQRFSLRWNNYQSQLVSAFESLLDQEDFVDVTLGVEGKKLSAHKMLLSACSPFFKELLKDNPCQHPIIILRDIKFEDVHSLVHFMYNGEVNVAQNNLNSFLKSAETLKIRGLTDDDNNSQGVEPVRKPTANSRRDKKRQNSSSSQNNNRTYLNHQSESTSQQSHETEHSLSKASRRENLKQEVIDLGDTGQEVVEDEEETVHPVVESQEFEENVHGSIEHEEYEEEQEILGDVQQGYIYDEMRVYTCDICSKTFHHPESFSSHRKYHSGHTTCQHCNHQFSTVGTLNRHIRNVHKVEPKFLELFTFPVKNK